MAVESWDGELTGLPFDEPCVYYFWSRTGDLLYIGSTKSLVSRLGGHARDGRRLGNVERVTWRHFDTLAEARREEAAEIMRRRPALNVLGNHGSPEEVATARAELRQAQRRRRDRMAGLTDADLAKIDRSPVPEVTRAHLLARLT